MKLRDNTQEELRAVLDKASKTLISSIPTHMQDVNQYIRELLSSLGEKEVIELHAPNIRYARFFQGKWKQLAVGRQPHTQKIRQSDSSYLVYLWLGGAKKGDPSNRLDDDTERRLQEVLERAKKIPISSIPDTTQDNYRYMNELLSSLEENEAIELRAHDSKEANTLRNRWRQLAVGRQPHTQTMKQSDGSYLVYLWLGRTVLDEILKMKPPRRVRKPEEL